MYFGGWYTDGRRRASCHHIKGDVVDVQQSQNSSVFPEKFHTFQQVTLLTSAVFQKRKNSSYAKSNTFPCKF